MHQGTSKYANHPRITWFGRGGTVAYVDYVSATESYFIGASGSGGFWVIPPNNGDQPAPDNAIKTGFATIDDGIEYALDAVG